MDVYWLEQIQADLPTDLDWLSKRETDRFNEFHFAKRRADWLLGRWTGKLAVAAHLGLSPALTTLRDIEIVAAPCGAPEVFFARKLLDFAISLSHSSDMAACALTSSGRALGCDLEQVEPRSDAFISDYFTADEQALVRSGAADRRWRLASLLWSAKESALKALRAGLRLDTRCMRVTLERHGAQGAEGSRDWLPLRVRYTGGQVFHGWWRESEKFVQTLVADPAPNVPIQCVVPGNRFREIVNTSR
jgi:4'-phosphopantetheinyl transferase